MCKGWPVTKCKACHGTVHPGLGEGESAVGGTLRYAGGFARRFGGVGGIEWLS